MPERRALQPGRDSAPSSALHFRVHIAGAGALAADIGFCEVVFPPFSAVPEGVTASAATATPTDTPPTEMAATGAPIDPPVTSSAPASTLILRRGFDGRLDLYRWWDATRRCAPRRGRTVTVELLNGEGREPIVAWLFGNARPTLLQYSPLDALHGKLLIETLTLRFDTLRMR